MCMENKAALLEALAGGGRHTLSQSPSITLFRTNFVWNVLAPGPPRLERSASSKKRDQTQLSLKSVVKIFCGPLARPGLLANG